MSDDLDFIATLFWNKSKIAKPENVLDLRNKPTSIFNFGESVFFLQLHKDYTRCSVYCNI